MYIDEVEIKVENKIEDKKEQIIEQEPIQAFASFNEYQQMFLNTNYPNGMNTFTNFTIPKYYKDQVVKAKELRNYDIVDRLIRIRQDYTLPIYQFKCKLKKQQKFYNEVVLPLVKDISKQWIYEHLSVGDTYGHYGFKSDKKTPMYFVIEDSTSITPISALGYEIYKIKLSPDLKEQIKKLKKENMIDRLPEYLRKAIDPNSGQINSEITLDKSNMNRSVNQKQNYELRSKPPLLRIMKSLVLREFLIDLDHMNAFGSQKTSIIHTRCGSEKEPIKDDKLLKSIHEMITNRPPGQVFITTRGDISIGSVNIDLSKMFDNKKFEECNKRVLDFFGITVAFVPSGMTGINNSTVTVSVEPLIASMETDREIFNNFLTPFFEEINRRNGFNEIPELQYSLTNLTENKEFREKLRFLFDTGVISYQDICEIYSYSQESQLEKRKWDHANRDNISPTWELSQGLSPMHSDLVTQKIKIANETKQTNNPDLNLSNNNQMSSK
jgi:peptide methionine sulfoxide reductase MsrA